MKYEESDNPLVRGARIVTDKVQVMRIPSNTLLNIPNQSTYMDFSNALPSVKAETIRIRSRICCKN